MTEDEKREKAFQDVKMYMANDWELVEETPEFFLLRRNRMTLLKHVIVFVFFWWSFGFVNLIAHLLGRQKKKIVK